MRAIISLQKPRVYKSDRVRSFMIVNYSHIKLRYVYRIMRSGNIANR